MIHQISIKHAKQCPETQIKMLCRIKLIKSMLSETYCTNDDCNAKGQGQTSIIIFECWYVPQYTYFTL